MMQTTFEESTTLIKLHFQDLKSKEIKMVSEKFTIGKEGSSTEWNIEVFPRFKDDGKDYVSVFLALLSKSSDCNIHCNWKLSIINKFGNEENTKCCNYVYKKVGGYGFAKFIDKDVLFSESRGLVRDNQLTLSLELKVEEETKFMLPERKYKYSPQFEKFYVYKLFTDIILSCEGRLLRAHKIILADQCPVLSEKLQNENPESLEIRDLKFEILQEMINYMYKDRVDNLKRNAHPLIIAAENYKLDRLKKICERNLYENLNIENAIEILIIADDHKLEELLNESLLFMEAHIKVIVKNLEWDSFISNHSELFNKLVKNWILNNDERMIKQELPDKKAIIEYKENELNDDFEGLFEKQLFTDVSFNVAGKTLKAHKSILCSRSPAFAQMLSHEINEINIDGIEYEAFKELLRFVYCGRVTNLKIVALDLLPAADKYDLDKLKIICENYLKDNLSLETAIDTYKMGCLHNCIDLKKKTSTFMKFNIMKLIESTKWDNFVKKHPTMVNEIFLKWVNESFSFQCV